MTGFHSLNYEVVALMPGHVTLSRGDGSSSSFSIPISPANVKRLRIGDEVLMTLSLIPETEEDRREFLT